MLLKYKYKLKPHKSQAVIISNWLSMARLQYNYRLAERLNWFEATRTRVYSCPLNASVVGTLAFLLSWAVTKMRTSVQRIYQNIPPLKNLANPRHF
ncbi:MAG: helix-turn-helix domain-containing protein [Okeania sp. SIO3I5]|uniref:helix-turn-helix domain-containing protein n=1 Tax=Okeania sp. SIO3I5 TaxID=2607805 RepID=UPI0013B5EDBD|nr:helix-turn-helix domain-containing protein [Okeania sp. SIO3I5]NEQ41696.1 helix-turn-helix domain-containing protein [Okeania sp. SIO3I5]